MRKNKKGFTLIEIIVVLVIMGILLAIAIPSILGYVKKAEDAQLMANVRNNYMQAEMYMNEAIIDFPNRDNTTQYQAYLKEKLKDIYDGYLDGNDEILTSLEDFEIQNIAIYFDDLKNPSKFDMTKNTHYISKIGIMYVNDANEGFVGVVRRNEKIKIFHDDAFMSDEEWSVDFTS